MDYQKSLITDDGIEVRHVSTKKHRSSKTAQLYVSRDGRGYSLSSRGLCHTTSSLCSSKKLQLSGNSRWGEDLLFKHYNMLVNRAVWAAWNPYGYDTIPKGYQIHHLNGIKSDNCIDNLVCLSQSEHSNWEKRLKMIKEKLGSPRAIPYANLRTLQAMTNIELQYHFDSLKQDDVEALMNYEITHHVEFLEHD